ncbi:MAG: hydantoinase B/oxoprolinase family protein [Gammaproteobacteria bacterium]|nr:hydantoinase B/oxoprolinase family protein [Gammaproteobacteria bacterium]
MSNKSLSLDELVRANKDQFDRIFSHQMQQTNLQSGFEAIRSETGVAGETRPVVASASDSNIVNILNQQYGDDWSHELIEHTTTGNELRVVCRLQAGGITQTQSGTAQVSGNIGIAVQRATNNALAQCYAQIDTASSSTAKKQEPRSPVGDAAPVRAAVPTAAMPLQTGRRARPGQPIDAVTLDLIENALRNARHEMDAVLFRSAMSPVIREQHDEFSMITDPKGRMIVGQFGSYVAEMLRENRFDLAPGDIILQSDPYQCGGAVSHINDWLVLIPIFHNDTLVGFSSMFGHMMDVGGPAAGSMPTTAQSIFGEGIRIPPIKIYDRGQLNQAALDLVLNNTRTPDMNYSDLMAIIAGSRTGEKRVIEICQRFGTETYFQACEELLLRTNRAMRQLIVQNLSTEPKSFEDYVDDDGCGNGPFKLKLTVWREGEDAYFDWTGTSDQAPGPINFYLHEGMFKMFIGVYMIMAFDPQILLNDGFYDLIHVKMPKGSVLQPEFPAALGCRTHALARQFDVLGGALSHNAPEMATAAGCGSSPHFLYSGVASDGAPFQLMEILYGGIPGRPLGDGIDGHSWWPLFENIPTEYLETYFPLVIESYTSICDSGGAGKHRGGNGVEKIYRILEPGEISIHDDRHQSHPWGILGGKPGACSAKWLVQGDGGRKPLPSKVDHVGVYPGDKIIFQTAGAGGWGDPLERDSEAVQKDVVRRLVTIEVAREAYGVVLDPATLQTETKETEALRQRIRSTRGVPTVFDFGKQVKGELGSMTS